MKRSTRLVAKVGGFSILVMVMALPAVTSAKKQLTYTSSFGLDTCVFASTGTNTFFILQPGLRRDYQGVDRDGTHHLIITVTDTTKTIAGVVTRVVEERETVNGKVIEVSTNYFAFCTRNNSVFYFGEDSNQYADGVVVDTSGSWHAGVNGATAGLVMPDLILLGARYQQEVAPSVAMDRAEILSVTQVVQTPAGVFSNCLQTVESTPLEKHSTEFKWYAPGIGLIKDDFLVLVPTPP